MYKDHLILGFGNVRRRIEIGRRSLSFSYMLQLGELYRCLPMSCLID